MQNQSKKECDVPSAAESEAYRKIVDHGIAYQETLANKWNDLPSHKQDMIDRIARGFHPDDLEARQTTTRALVLLQSLTPEAVKWLTTFEDAFKIERPTETPPEAIID